jgi:hypothetical protein
MTDNIPGHVSLQANNNNRRERLGEKYIMAEPHPQRQEHAHADVPTLLLASAGFPAKMAHYYSARFPRLDLGGGRSGSGELYISAADGLFCNVALAQVYHALVVYILLRDF